MNYYARHRDELLEKQKAYNNRPENKERLKSYRRQYYLSHRPPPPSPEITALIQTVKDRTTDLRGTSTHQRRGKRGARPPKPVWETSIDPSEEKAMSGYKLGRIMKNNSQGIYQRPPDENPFRVVFS